MSSIVFYSNLLDDIKTRIRQTQVKATLSANAEMIGMYWDVGRMIHIRQQQEGWSASIIPNLSKDLKNELPEVKGFSERNLGRMLAFFRKYQDLETFLPQPVAKTESSEILQQAVAKLPTADLIQRSPWGHHMILFVGRQYHLAIGDSDFYIDLLFYHLKLRSFVVIELKKGDFKPEYAGKMNFYCSAVDDLLKHPTDQLTIGLILCQTKNQILAEYALRDIHKPIGISEYELTRALPENLKSSLPSIEEIEAELGGIHEAGEDKG